MTCTILITGCSRGLGLAWVRNSAARGWRVLATSRADPHEAGALLNASSEYAGITRHRLDVTSVESIETLADELGESAIDVLVHNAGVGRSRLTPDRIGNLDFSEWERCWRTNVLGPALVTDVLVEHVARSERRLVVVITSEMGCTGRIRTPGDYAYRGSKGALNTVFRGMALELAKRNIGVLLLNPGWVRTDMGGPSAPLLPDASVSGMLDRVDSFRMEQSGRLFNYNGAELSW
jgi:NAD(P)-dependent dehydrogenase (short-subunit alcohol dehydrogenase family)